MTTLLEQFLSESREALEDIGEKLMQLEHAPSDAVLMTEMFRHVHTLKGNSGLFDFPEMTRVLHAGEDLMDAVRTQRVVYSEALADRLLDAMDFVGLLCDDIEAERPHAVHIAADALTLSGLLRGLIDATVFQSGVLTASLDASPATDSISSAQRAHLTAWLAQVPEELRLGLWRERATGSTLFWVTYHPADECYFQGVDPLHQALSLPGYQWSSIQARAPWPPLNELDAFRCQLNFEILVACERAEIDEHFRYVSEQIKVVAVPELELVIPQGGHNGGPVYDDFVADALGLLERQDLAGLSRAVRSLIDLSNPGLWLSSALRWLQLMLTHEPLDNRAMTLLVKALLTLEVPDWSMLDDASQLPSDVLTPSVVVNVPAVDLSSQKEALGQLLAVQREILLLPDDGPWFAGRIKASAKSLGACLRAQDRTSELEVLARALATSLENKTAHALNQWLSQAFPDVDTTMPIMDTDELDLLTTIDQPESPSITESDVRLGKRNDDIHNVKSLKVDQTKVDRLMNLIGEMVVAKNAIPYLANRAETHFGVRELSREIKAHYAVINRISEEMQDAIMQVRMMPVSFVFQRFPRLIRDISKRLGKDVQLVLEGEETAADKNIIESLGDPLIHMVRNSLDHGLEMPEVRRAAGKPVNGQLKITARQEADSVVIDISDDGKGIDPDEMKRKAYEKGLIDEQTLERISNQDAINLVFLPGFSTAETISDLSGRGVGMDVVRTAIERVSGSISIQSTKGVGTSFRLKLPLSMAVTKVMTVSTDGQTFGIPMDAVVETVRIPRTAMRPIKQGLVTLLRGNVVPLKSLNRSLGLSAPPLANENDELAVLVVRAGDVTVGLLVDDFLETVEIILKPMDGILTSIRAYSGSALMGDGSVLMVLNVKEMV